VSLLKDSPTYFRTALTARDNADVKVRILVLRVMLRLVLRPSCGLFIHTLCQAALEADGIFPGPQHHTEAAITNAVKSGLDAEPVLKCQLYAACPSWIVALLVLFSLFVMG